MWRRLSIALVFLSSVAISAVDKIQPLNIKVGLWEVTTTMNSSAQMPIPASLLEKLTPEQRARVEERMNSRSSSSAKAIKSRHCLSQEQLDRGASFGEVPKFCTPTILSSTPSKMEIRAECTENGVKWEVRARFEAIDSENVKGQTESSGDDHTLNSNSTFTAKRIAPVCGMIK